MDFVAVSLNRELSVDRSLSLAKTHNELVKIHLTRFYNTTWFDKLLVKIRLRDSRLPVLFAKFDGTMESDHHTHCYSAITLLHLKNRRRRSSMEPYLYAGATSILDSVMKLDWLWWIFHVFNPVKLLQYPHDAVHCLSASELF